MEFPWLGFCAFRLHVQEKIKNNRAKNAGAKACLIAIFNELSWGGNCFHFA
jgi:hypothetical protein